MVLRDNEDAIAKYAREQLRLGNRAGASTISSWDAYAQGQRAAAEVNLDRARSTLSGGTKQIEGG